jgi:hypothetical protein
MEDDEQPPASSTEASAPQGLWGMSRDERRLLMITFVGGLASIVAGVCVVGAAIALVRGMRAIHIPLGYLVAFTLVYASFLIWITQFRRKPGPMPMVSLILWLLIYVALAICLLAWIGLAAGIH